jgi:vacuolar-type H+-ATPase subunit H
MSVTPSEARAPDTTTSKREAAGQAAEAAGQAAANVTETAKEQARRVADEASTQARNVASEVKGKVTDQARTQNDRLVHGIRRMSDELDQMRAERQDSPAASVVSRVADGGRQVADYLADNGPEGVLREVQEFARRRPGAFLATALTAGFVVGRLGKGVLNAAVASPTSTKPRSDSFTSGVRDTERSYETDYRPEVDYSAASAGATTQYAATQYAATGTGTPIAVDPLEADIPRYPTEPGYEPEPPFTAEPSYTEPTYEAEPGHESRPR